MKRIAIITSGGDAPGMNAVIRAVVRTAIYEGAEIYGVEGGYEGLIEGKLKRLYASSVADIIQRGGTILGTSRSERFITEEGFNKALQVLEIFGINKVIVAGGDGSLRGALKLSKAGIDVVGIPLSIDNDLGYTDYTIGFFTAVETVTEAISKIRDTTEAHGRANIVEVMGRNCGDIALYSGLAGGAESIIVPEIKENIDEIIKKAIVTTNRGKKYHIIIMAEGAGDSREFAKEFERLTGIETKVTVLGYIQRGGRPNIVDRMLASTIGNKAVTEVLREGASFAIGFTGGEIRVFDLEEALSIKKEFNNDINRVVKTISI